MSLAPGLLLSTSTTNILFQVLVTSHLNITSCSGMGKPEAVGQIQPAKKNGFYIFTVKGGVGEGGIKRLFSDMWELYEIQIWGP